MTTGHLAFSLACLVGSMACADLTEPPAPVGVVPNEEPAEAPAAATAAPAATAAADPPPTAPTNEMVTASHILIAYKGALRASPSIERSKDAAKTRAEQVLARARKGEDFGKLADEMSDDPSAKMNHGELGKFSRQQMVKPFADAAFALRPGQVSDLVETPFGFHVIKRTE